MKKILREKLQAGGVMLQLTLVGSSLLASSFHFRTPLAAEFA
jgi:hypothetical protein